MNHELVSPTHNPDVLTRQSRWLAQHHDFPNARNTLDFVWAAPGRILNNDL